MLGVEASAEDVGAELASVEKVSAELPEAEVYARRDSELLVSVSLR